MNDRQKSKTSIVSYTAPGQGRRTVVYGGWSQKGNTLHNALVIGLTTNREKLDLTMMDIKNEKKPIKIEF